MIAADPPLRPDPALVARIRSGLQQVRDGIATATQRAARPAEAVRLIAVSKTQPAAAIAAAYDAGQRDFGENTVKDALSKIPHFSSEALNWHFIGHVQSNKAKFLPQYFDWVHSVDSLKLAQALARQADKQGAVLKLLLQVNISQEPQKHGIAPDQIYSVVEQLQCAALPGIGLHGLMGMAPQTRDEALQRRCFAQLRELLGVCRQRFDLPHFNELSMGMSGDYPAAIAEGATMVRVGSAIFGARNPM